MVSKKNISNLNSSNFNSNNSNSNNTEDISLMYKEDAKSKIKDILDKYSVDINTGLSSDLVKENTLKYGQNIIKGDKPKRWYQYFFKSLFNPFNSILICIILILIYTDIYLANVPSYANIIVVAVLVLSSTILEFFQEYRSNKAANKLKELVATNATVIREGITKDIPIKDITVGDIVILSSGSMIPADVRVLESKDLYIGESQLTGESDSVKKIPENIDLKINTLSDIDTICFMGTNVISGSSKAIVIKTGDDTYFRKNCSHFVSENLKLLFN